MACREPIPAFFIHSINTMKFDVFIPCTASICVTVDAESEEEAKQLALDAPWRIKIDAKGCVICDNTMDIAICEFAVHEQIIKGNVFYGVQNEIEVCEAE
jgi:hypothetical protein